MGWECFEDAAYFDMWCVRPAGERRFGYGYHLNSKEEAEGMRNLLSEQEAKLAKAREALEKIEAFGVDKPGHGRSCSNIALLTLKEIDNDG